MNGLCSWWSGGSSGGAAPTATVRGGAALPQCQSGDKRRRGRTPPPPPRRSKRARAPPPVPTPPPIQRLVAAPGEWPRTGPFAAAPPRRTGRRQSASTPPWTTGERAAAEAPTPRRRGGRPSAARAGPLPPAPPSPPLPLTVPLRVMRELALTMFYLGVRSVIGGRSGIGSPAEGWILCRSTMGDQLYYYNLRSGAKVYVGLQDIWRAVKARVRGDSGLGSLAKRWTVFQSTEGGELICYNTWTKATVRIFSTKQMPSGEDETTNMDEIASLYGMAAFHFRYEGGSKSYSFLNIPGITLSHVRWMLKKQYPAMGPFRFSLGGRSCLSEEEEKARAVDDPESGVEREDSPTCGPFRASYVLHIKAVNQNGEEENCTICQSNLFDLDVPAGLEGLRRELPCSHRFHEHCIRPWLREQSTCPVCRHDLGEEEESKAEET